MQRIFDLLMTLNLPIGRCNFICDSYKKDMCKFNSISMLIQSFIDFEDWQKKLWPFKVWSAKHCASLAASLFKNIAYVTKAWRIEFLVTCNKMIAVLSTKMHELKSGLGMLHVLTTFLTLNKKVLMSYGHFFWFVPSWTYIFINDFQKLQSLNFRDSIGRFRGKILCVPQILDFLHIFTCKWFFGTIWAFPDNRLVHT